jgi:hypothetical protein
MRLKIAIKRQYEDHRRRRRWTSFAASLALHFAVAATILSVKGTVQRDALTDTKYEVLPLATPRDTKLTWYDFRKAVPEIAPNRRFGSATVPQGEKDPRTLIARSQTPKSTQQVVQQPDPAPLLQDIRAPNLVSTPRPPEPKQFVPPPSEQPRLNSEPARVLEAPPQLDSAFSVKPIGIEQSILRLPPRRFVAPSKKTDSTNPSSAPTIIDKAALDIQVAVIGMNPSEQLLMTLPLGSRPAEFARAPVAGSVSSGAAPDTARKLADLATRGAVMGTPAVVSTGAPAHNQRIVKEMVFPALNRTMSAPLRPSSRVIPPTVEVQFSNRNVYTLVIPDVGLPEYSGDWVLWFAEDPSVGNQTAYISAPVPARKYSAAELAESTNERFVGGATLAARIDRSGRVSSVRLLRGPTPEDLRRRVIEELETWEFTPALRNREPVAVDVVVEFPFRRGGEVREAVH